MTKKNKKDKKKKKKKKNREKKEKTRISAVDVRIRGSCRAHSAQLPRVPSGRGSEQLSFWTPLRALRRLRPHRSRHTCESEGQVTAELTRMGIRVIQPVMLLLQASSHSRNRE
jgi:hypothetical protein